MGGWGCPPPFQRIPAPPSPLSPSFLCEVAITPAPCFCPSSFPLTGVTRQKSPPPFQPPYGQNSVLTFPWVRGRGGVPHLTHVWSLRVVHQWSFPHLLSAPATPQGGPSHGPHNPRAFAWKCEAIKATRGFVAQREHHHPICHSKRLLAGHHQNRSLARLGACPRPHEPCGRRSAARQSPGTDWPERMFVRSGCPMSTVGTVGTSIWCEGLSALLFRG